MAEEDDIELFHIDEKTFGVDYKEKLFEQYKLYLQSIDNLISRRTLANNFFLGINTGLLSTLAFLFNFGITVLDGNGLWILGGSGSGILFAFTWYRTVSSYRQLSNVKWKIIIEIEKKLPIAIHEIEWKLLGQGQDSKKYKQLTIVEQYIPKIFIIFYLIMIVFAISILLGF
jgi:hypothetical protein